MNSNEINKEEWALLVVLDFLFHRLTLESGVKQEMFKNTNTMQGMPFQHPRTKETFELNTQHVPLYKAER